MKSVFYLVICTALFILSGCTKEEEKFNFNDIWWKGDTYGGNTVMHIKFISDTEFKFENEGKGDRPSFASGTGTYTQNGNTIVMDFETASYSIAPAHITLDSGVWDIFPTNKEEAHDAKLTIKGTHWVSMGSVNTDPEVWEKTLTYDFTKNGW